MGIAAVARQMRPQRRRAVPVELLNAEAPMGLCMTRNSRFCCPHRHQFLARHRLLSLHAGFNQTGAQHHFHWPLTSSTSSPIQFTGSGQLVRLNFGGENNVNLPTPSFSGASTLERGRQQPMPFQTVAPLLPPNNGTGYIFYGNGNCDPHCQLQANIRYNWQKQCNTSKALSTRAFINASNINWNLMKNSFFLQILTKQKCSFFSKQKTVQLRPIKTLTTTGEFVGANYLHSSVCQPTPPLIGNTSTGLPRMRRWRPIDENYYSEIDWIFWCHFRSFLIGNMPKLRMILKWFFC